VPRIAAFPIVLAAALAISGCGSDKTKTVTETKTVTVTSTTATPPPDDRSAILDAAGAFYAASTATGTKPNDLSLVKTDGTFADVNVGNEAHAILKKAGGLWVVVFDGNGSIPRETRQRYGIPAGYGG
jgi:ABC-type glycerol-3-phosphate transport system substrate-binding protein